MKRLLLSSFIAASLLQLSAQTTVTTLVNQVSQTGIMTMVNELSGEVSTVVGGNPTTIQHRVSSWGNNTAATYIKEHLISYGLTASEINYSSGGRNVVAKQIGLVNPNKIFLICAHYDAVSYHGASDNASGVTAILEAARILSKYQFENTIVYALWDEEETGLNGSDDYATTAKQNGDQIQAAVNLDMIGCDGDNDKRFDIDVRNIANSYTIKNDLLSMVSTFGLNLVGYVVDPGTSASDHGSFWQQGYSAVLVGEAWSKNDIAPGYHTQNDRVADFNNTYFFNMVKLMVAYTATKAVLISGAGVETALHPLFSLYPNPVADQLHVEFAGPMETELRILNMIGEQVMSYPLSGKRAVLPVQHLPAGLYFIQLVGDTRRFTYKFLKQ